MKTDSKALLRELAAIATEDFKAIEAHNNLPDDIINRKPSSDAWSALECLEHLNLYAAFYLPKTSIVINKNSARPSSVFKSGLFGNYLTGMVKVKNGSKKMKTFVEMNPNGKTLDRAVLKKFLDNQRQLLTILKEAEDTDLNNGRIPVTFSRLIRLKPGDILRFMVYHNQRHVQQALRAIGQQ